jgi:CheY-like chemotaxis protein
LTDEHRVLLVDDDEVFGHALARFLVDAGLEVTVAPDYRKALQVLESGAPVDLLLTDVVMPDRVNGLALARMALLRRPSIKVIYLSGYDIPGLDGEALGPVLQKPVEGEHLLGVIRRVLAG